MQTQLLLLCYFYSGVIYLPWVLELCQVLLQIQVQLGQFLSLWEQSADLYITGKSMMSFEAVPTHEDWGEKESIVPCIPELYMV